MNFCTYILYLLHIKYYIVEFFIHTHTHHGIYDENKINKRLSKIYMLTHFNYIYYEQTIETINT